jgi:type VI secretion system protein ImpH
MAAQSRYATTSLRDILLSEPWTMDFYQAVSVAEWLLPHKRRVATTVVPGDESVSFTSSVSLSFPASEIRTVAESDSGGYVFDVAFMGLAGILGPLPLPYTEYIIDRVKAKDTATRDFLDVFNSRLIGLMYRSRATRKPTLFRGTPEEHPMVDTLLALMGMSRDSRDSFASFDVLALLRYLPVLSTSPRPFSALSEILSDFLSLPITATPFEGAWVEIDVSARTALGGDNSSLGVSAVAGSKAWNPAAGVLLSVDCSAPRLRPEDIPLPTSKSFFPLLELASFYMDGDAEVEIAIRGARLPQAGLGRARLGWDGTLGADAVADLRISPRVAKELRASVCAMDEGLSYILENICLLSERYG